MKDIFLNLFLAAVLTAAAGSQANATISAIASDLCSGAPCLPHVVQPVVRGVDGNKVSTMTVKGQFVDTSTAVEVSGSGVSVSYGTRTHGNNSSIVIRFTVSPSAALGERTVRMRYAIETNGPDTFKIKIVRGGDVTEIKRKVTAVNPLTGAPLTTYHDPTSLPLNTPVVLRFRGSNIGSASLKAISGISNIQKLPGCSETECQFQMTFTQSGTKNLNLFDGGAGNLQNNSLAYKFYYSGVSSVTVSGTATSGSTFVQPILSGGGSSPSTFLDVAPKAFIGNVFRRNTANSFTDNTGRQFFAVSSNFSNLCSGLSGNASRLVTVPNPVWGVSNVGTANVATDFQVQLRSGNNVLDTETITTDLPAGATRDFTFDRPGDSQVRVFTFLNRIGCFISPQADKFFEDPAYSVTVDTTGVLNESNESNNARNF